MKFSIPIPGALTSSSRPLLGGVIMYMSSSGALSRSTAFRWDDVIGMEDPIHTVSGAFTVTYEYNIVQYSGINVQNCVRYCFTDKCSWSHVQFLLFSNHNNNNNNNYMYDYYLVWQVSEMMRTGYIYVLYCLLWLMS